MIMVSEGAVMKEISRGDAKPADPNAKPADPKNSYTKENMKKDLGKRMSVLESLDKKGNDEEFVPWAMGWIKSATGIGARAT